MTPYIFQTMKHMVDAKVLTIRSDRARFDTLISVAMLSPRDGITLRALRTAGYPSKERSVQANGSRVPKSHLVLKK